MTFGGSSISNFAGVVGRTFRNKRATSDIQDNDFDLYERAPVLRSDVAALLNAEVEYDADEQEQEELLRASEKLEHDTICQIRGALYPADVN